MSLPLLVVSLLLKPEGGLHPNSNVRENLREDEAESPFSKPPPNVINLDLEATDVHIIAPCPSIFPSPLPPRKPSKIWKVFPPCPFGLYLDS